MMAMGTAHASCASSIDSGVVPSCMLPVRIGPTNRARIAPIAPKPTTFVWLAGSVKRIRLAVTVPTMDPVATSATSGPRTMPPHSEARMARIAPT